MKGNRKVTRVNSNFNDINMRAEGIRKVTRMTILPYLDGNVRLVPFAQDKLKYK